MKGWQLVLVVVALAGVFMAGRQSVVVPSVVDTRTNDSLLQVIEGLRLMREAQQELTVGLLVKLNEVRSDRETLQHEVDSIVAHAGIDSLLLILDGPDLGGGHVGGGGREQAEDVGQPHPLPGEGEPEPG